MKPHKLLSIILAIAILFSANPSLQAGQPSCENSESSNKSEKTIYGFGAVSAIILALVSLNWCKHKDEPAQNETEESIEKSVIPKTTTNADNTSINKVSINPTGRQENWIRILAGETIPNEYFRYNSGREFRQDTDENLETNHDFIQVFFPTYEQSRFANPDLNIDSCRELWRQVATEENHATIKCIQREMLMNSIRMLLFWGFKVVLNIPDIAGNTPLAYEPSDSRKLFSPDSPDCLEGHDFQLIRIALDVATPWSSNVDDHNRLRITRVLKSLKIFGLDSAFHSLHTSFLFLLQSNKIADTRSCSNSSCIGETEQYWQNAANTQKLLEGLNSSTIN